MHNIHSFFISQGYKQAIKHQNQPPFSLIRSIAQFEMGTTLGLLLLTILLNISSSLQSQYQNYSFSSFTPSNRDNFTFSFDAGINQGALQITPDSMNNAQTFLVNKSGRVLLKNPFTLWRNSTGSSKVVASFNTTFNINIFRVGSLHPGEGFAFIIAPNQEDPPVGSYGQYLGLTNSTLDGKASNHIIAIELDTVKQSFDPDSNHISLDINSVRSNTSTPLTPYGIDISPVNSTVYTVWIDYDGKSRYVWVYMRLQNQSKPNSTNDAVLKSHLDLSEHVLEKSYLGFAASTGDTNLELNCVLSWNLTVEDIGDDDSGVNKGMESWKWALVIALPLLAAIVILGALFWCYYNNNLKRKDALDDPKVLDDTLRALPGTTREYDFKVLRKATNNFDEKMELGQGGYGTVYRGIIPGENTPVAVKKFSRDSIKGQDDFLAEVSIINRLRHKHLVRLLGWCHQNGMLLLVYDYMPNGSLEQHLFSPNHPILTWDQRYKILAGVASALHYLHNEFDQKVVHRDLKASNILLESNFNARLGDFGLARAIDTDKTSYVDVELGGVPGTVGYIAPECFHTGKATSESDVFAFGSVVLEVVCGRRPRCDISGFQFLADWVWKLHREGRIVDAVDTRLGGEFDKEDTVRLLLLGLACTHPQPKLRPKTAAIVQIILKSVAPPTVPPFKPAFVWPSGPVDDGDDNCTTDSMTSIEITSPFYGSSRGQTPRISDLFSN